VAEETLFGQSVVLDTDWTNSANATGSNDGTSATATVVGSPLVLALADLTETQEIETTSVTYGAWWTAQLGTSTRAQSALVELINTAGTVFASFNTGARDSATLAEFTDTFTPSHTLATVNDYRVRVSPQEGGGMAGTMTHFVDAARATPTYELDAGVELDVAGLGQAQTLGAVALVQAHTLAVADLDQAQSLDAVVLSLPSGKEYTGPVTRLGPGGGPAIPYGDFSGKVGIVLDVADLNQAQTFEAVALTQAYTLDIASLSSAQSLEAVELSFAATLEIANLAQAQSLEAVALTQAHTLSVNGLAQAQALEGVALTQANTLEIASLAQAQTLEAVVLSMAVRLDVADLNQSQAIDPVALTQAHTLIVNALAQAQSLSAVELTQAHTLALANLAQSQALEAVVLSQVTNLEVANLSQAQSLDSVALVQAHTLSVASLSQAQTLGSVELTQAHTLAIADLAQSQSLGALTLSVEEEDVVAPVLTAPTASNVGSSAVTPMVTTDEGNGTLYMVLVPDGDSPSVAQIKAGQDSLGAAAIADDSQAVTETGVQSFPRVSGLDAETAYELWFVQTDAAENDSDSVTAGFTTLGAVDFVGRQSIGITSGMRIGL
jgi:hypothetical protein